MRPASAFLDHPAAVAAASALASLLLLGRRVIPLGGIVEPGGDYGLMVWNLWFVDRAITHGENPYFTSLVYHPLGARLVKHTLVPGYWPVTLLARVLSGGDPLYPLYAYRLCILLSFTLALALTYVTLRRLGFARSVACVPGVAYAFCDFNMLHVPHLNHLSAAFLLPLNALALIRLCERPLRSRALVAAFVLAAGVYFTELVVFIWIAALLTLAMAAALPSTRAPVRRVAATLGAQGIVAALLAFALAVAPFALNWALVPGPVVNLPLSVFDGRAVFLQTFHGQPIATGFVSRRTPAQLAHVRTLDLLLAEDPAAFLRHLGRIGVRNIILGPETPPDVAGALTAGAINVVDLRGEAPVH